MTVKRTAEGYASNWICEHLRVGDTMRVLPPSGIFTPASLDADLLLCAGGSGVTPIMSITRTCLSEGSGRIVLFYANRDEQSVIFAKELSALSAAHPERLQVIHWLESVQGLPSQEQMKAFLAGYLAQRRLRVRPAPFMKMTIAAAKELEFPRERRHQEKFISLGGNPFGDLHDVETAVSEITAAETDEEDAQDSADASRAPVSVGGRARRPAPHLRRLGPPHQAAGLPGEQGREGAVLLPRGGVLGLRDPSGRG